MIGDQSEIHQHLSTARKHADQAETEAKPELYREAIDELCAAIQILMRNVPEQEGNVYSEGSNESPAGNR
jgi:hypothetical protein